MPQHEDRELAALAAKLQKIRENSGLTLEELSEMTGVSTGFLSQLERGRANPSFSTLMKISNGLQVSIASFFGGPETTTPMVVRRSERRKLAITEGEPTDMELLTPEPNLGFDVVCCTYAAGDETAKPVSHNGVEFAVVLQGVLEGHIGEQTTVLEPGDSISFHSSVPHWFCGRGDADAVAIWVHAPTPDQASRYSFHFPELNRNLVR